MPGSRHTTAGTRRGRRALLAGSLALGLAASGALSPRAVRADQPGWSVVEASQDFCVDASQPCSDLAHLGNLGYEEVAAVNFNGQPLATPSAVVLVCAKAYTAPNGDVHNLSGHVFAGPTDKGYDGGSIAGIMSVVQTGSGGLRYGTEVDTYARGRVGLVASDPVMGTLGTANGEQITDNVADTPLGGQIQVTIRGNLTDEDFTAGTPPTVVPNATITCSIHPPYAIGPAPIGQPPDSESVIADTDGD